MRLRLVSLRRAAVRLAVVLSILSAYPARGSDDQKGPGGAESKAPDLLAQAIDAFKAADLPKAAQKLELLLKGDPRNRDGLVLLAKIKAEQGMEQARPASSAYFLKAAELARRALALPKEPGKHEKLLFATIFYYEACTYAVDKKPEDALKALTDAFKLGFVDLDSLDMDEELDLIRKRPEFQQLRRQMEQKALPIAREHAAELLASNKPFPFSFELTDLDGKKVALAGLKGKVAIIDVWGTWCPPCRMEIPHFVNLYERFHDKGLEIVGVNYEREEGDTKARELVRAFVKENGVPYRCVIGDEKTQALIPNFEGFPTTLFIDREGTVRLKVVGYHSRVDLEAIVAHLLNETPGKAR